MGVHHKKRCLIGSPFPYHICSVDFTRFVYLKQALKIYCPQTCLNSKCFSYKPSSLWTTFLGIESDRRAFFFFSFFFHKIEPEF